MVVPESENTLASQVVHVNFHSLFTPTNERSVPSINPVSLVSL